MKTFNTVAIVVLIIAVGYLFIKDSGSNTADNSPKSVEEVKANLEGQDFKGVRVAYIDTDSLVSKYELHKELAEKLQAKARLLENDMAQKAQVFQQNVQVLEQQAANMSQDELQAAQMDLQQTQQQLMAYRDQKGAELAKEQRALDSLIMDDLKDVVEGLKDELGLDYILSYDPNSILLAANENYNITGIVVERLNAKNNKSKASKEDEE